jgi:hypothetical protein
MGDGGDPDQQQRDQGEHVDGIGHRPEDDHVDVLAVDLLGWRRARRAHEVPDRARRVVPPEPDPAEFVQGAAVPGVQGECPFLMGTRQAQRAGGQAHLAGQEVHIGFARRELTSLARGGVGDVEMLAGQRRLRHAHMGLPQLRCQQARFAGRPQRVGVVAQVNQRVAGQPVRPLVGRVERDRPVGRPDRVDVPLGAQVGAGEQAPGPAAVRFGGHYPRDQRGRLIAAPDIEHRRCAGQFLSEVHTH